MSRMWLPLLLVILSRSFAGTKSNPPNIVIFLADDLGFNDVSWHNSDILTPHLEELARSGLVLENAYMQPMCTASRSALLTGCYPIHTGRQDYVLKSQEPTGLYTNFTLLPERLQHLGYHSHIIGKWHLGCCHEDYLPTSRGFDSFSGLYHGWGEHYLHTYDTNVGGGPDGYDFHDGLNNNIAANNTYSTYFFAGEAERRISRHSSDHAGEPLFLYIAFTAPHTPLQAPSELLDLFPNVEDEGRRTYSAMVAGMDMAVGRVVEALRQYGLYENSIILWSSDNGAITTSEGSGSNYPLRGQKDTLWEGGTRAPSFLHSPLFNSAGEVYDGLIHVTDWFPTLYSAAGGNATDLGEIDGIDQWDALLQRGPSNRQEMLYNCNPMGTQSPTGCALRWGNMKLAYGDIGDPGGDGSSSDDAAHDDHRVRLFDLGADPTESTDVAPARPALAAAMLGRLAELQRTAIPPHVNPNVLAGNPNLNGGFFGTGWCELAQ